MEENLDSPTTFDDFDIDPRCLGVLHARGIVTPTPIQARTIPVALTGRDVVAMAQTGTGKTLAFALPALTRLAEGRLGPNLMLVLTPTRELAAQVHAVIEEMGKPLQIRSVCVYGGVALERQARVLRGKVNVVVATPGRLLDHVGRGNVRFDHLEILVVDEADRMLDMGFLPDLLRIIHLLPQDRQTIMCSATFPNEISRLANQMLRDPERISVGAIAKPVESVRQLVYTVEQERKTSLLIKLLREENIDSALIFMRTKKRTDRVANSLRKEGFKARPIHGDLTQSQREQALNGFREGHIKLLVATDVAARGLDIEGISHVINFDIPENADDYVHRIGRTARASAEGDAFTFVCPDEIIPLEALERSLGRNLPRAEWDGAVNVMSLYTPPSHSTAAKLATRHRRRSLFRRH